MTALPLVSIGLPVYNGEAHLAESIEALLGQTYDNCEFIISDNASTDATAEICRHYAQQDHRIRYVRQTRNIGLSPNHNFVLGQARGAYFKWASADDLYGRDLLRCCVEALNRDSGVVLAHSYEGVIDHQNAVTQALDYPLRTDSPRAPDRFRSALFGGSGLFESSDPADRNFVRVDNAGMLRACDVYGVARTAVMSQVAPLGSYHHSDRIIICALALHGRFHITPEWLYFRRDTPDRVYNKSPKLRDRCEINDPARKNRLLHPTGRLVAEYFLAYVGAIRQAPLSPADRRECYRNLLEWLLDRATNAVVPRRLVSAAEQLAGADQKDSVSISDIVAGQCTPVG